MRWDWELPPIELEGSGSMSRGRSLALYEWLKLNKNTASLQKTNFKVVHKYHKFWTILNYGKLTQTLPFSAHGNPRSAIQQISSGNPEIPFPKSLEELLPYGNPPTLSKTIMHLGSFFRPALGWQMSCILILLQVDTQLVPYDQGL